ncbi:receptor-like protein EIX2 [Cajanus cajan]|uniref:receptor-like protein EIX2 n=1 Tax=Cajanus cajan TaxID=3821 RepID=UPI0010FBB116|nr:receptor-like protein EIX2 [Cajanus cajan]
MDSSASNIKLILLSLLCLIMFSSVLCSLKVHCNKKDMNTLLHFRQGVIDPSGLLSSWFPELDCCQWKGVKCDNITGRVTELNLFCHTNQSKVAALEEMDDKSHCLTGELSLTLLELQFLSYLDLSNNDFKAIKYNSISSQKCDDLSRDNSHLCVLDMCLDKLLRVRIFCKR